MAPANGQHTEAEFRPAASEEITMSITARGGITAAFVMLACVAATHAIGAEYPVKPIRFIVPLPNMASLRAAIHFAAGGSSPFALMA